jgi:RNA polymerase sigma factor (sigma-70 family)
MGRRTSREVLGPIDRLFRTGTATGLSDEQLLERFATRHDEAAEAAFAALVDRHGPMVLGVCRRWLRDPNDAHDAFQATFLVLVRKAGGIRKRDSLAHWLYGVATRVSAHARVSSARRRAVERRAGESAPTSYESPPPADAFEVWEDVERLPANLRAAVVLCYLEGLTHEQAAQRLGWPVGTVRSRLARARERLRGALRRRGLAPETPLAPLLALPRVAPLETLSHSTVKAAMLVAARDAVEAGLVSASAASLTEGVLRIMLVSKLKPVALLAGVAGLALGAVVNARQDRGPDNIFATTPASASAPAGKRPAPGGLLAPVSSEDPAAAHAARIQELAKDALKHHEAGRIDAIFQNLNAIQREVDAWRQSVTAARPPEANSAPHAGARPGYPSSDRVVGPQPGFPSGGARPGGSDVVSSSSANGTPNPATTPFAPHGDTDTLRRLDELERKVDRILRALEKDRNVDPLDASPKRA